MSNETLETETLETLAEKIVKCATAADDRTIEAAILIRAARSRFENGEAGETTWSEWARKNTKLSTSRLRELQRIADAEDPKTELERIREQNKKRQARHRNKKGAAPLRNGDTTAAVTGKVEEDREHLIAWARSAPLDHVTEVLSYIQQLDAAEAESGSGESAGPAALM